MGIGGLGGRLSGSSIGKKKKLDSNQGGGCDPPNPPLDPSGAVVKFSTSLFDMVCIPNVDGDRLIIDHSPALRLRRQIALRPFSLLGSVSISTTDSPTLHSRIVRRPVGQSVVLIETGTSGFLPPGTPVSSTRKLISSSFHRLDMTLAVAEA